MIAKDLTGNPGILSIKGGGVWSLGHAGGGVGGEVQLLGQLYDGDVVVGVRVVLMVAVRGHFQGQLPQTSLSGAGQVMLSECDLSKEWLLFRGWRIPNLNIGDL